MPETPIFNIPWTEDDDYVKEWPALSKAIAEAVEAACGIATSVPQVTPPGAMTQFAGDKQHIPAGWLVCDGSSYSSNPTGLYYNLYKAISTRFGSDGAGPDGFDRFKVPNMNGLFPRGVVNDLGIGDAGKGGSDNAVVVSHTHSGSGTTSSAGHHSHHMDLAGHHSHTQHRTYSANYVYGLSSGPGQYAVNYGEYAQVLDYQGNHSHGLHGAGDHTHTFSVTTGGASGESDGIGKNVPAYMPMYYIIKI